MTVVITGGGTGGHIYPGIALAKRLREQGVAVEWLGAERGLEKTLVPKADIPLHLLHLNPVRQGGIIARFHALWQLFQAVSQARRLLRHIKPTLVIAMGGYASAAGGLAAKSLGIPLVLHEQNAAAGWTNRLLARLAKKVFLGFEGAFSGSKVMTVGNPVRDVFKRLPSPDERYGKRQGPIRVLVFGGSQGARIFNQRFPVLFESLARTAPITVAHISGASSFDAVKAAYASASFDVEVSAYRDQLDQDFAWADLVIARAGAMTVTEIMHTGVASLLIPLPFAVDDHQTKNAQCLVKAEAAELVAEKSFDDEVVLNRLKTLCQNRETLHIMAARAYAIRPKNTEEQLLNAIQDYL
ncbi:MAG: undecaprenyldiphospho-muramoylpentapeptide beta-N-acetylglucosaminyltransferase [Gammaproteobacteria bacterium CG11_big_fil_rev_8_21_14_0_20_46_22]|nr:MAG: undecaprenyldiphospho-muramoylpentapeptide beta-N-acetylglucosaminyltransferase [Gammaproteobacteria bacterium CG12_big_fil_rev_8_21_14_0_65_46_12]PIR10811.1 MAG: undecaprenyldiphospho-muramoylpentapeptide beta-N-acetylglucosaminyltransferase [Gammaproteobacteria bacterium CG11_big_fil_rev_8_21_14_0_20_46_22]